MSDLADRWIKGAKSNLRVEEYTRQVRLTRDDRDDFKMFVDVDHLAELIELLRGIRERMTKRVAQLDKLKSDAATIARLAAVVEAARAFTGRCRHGLPGHMCCDERDAVLAALAALDAAKGGA